MAIRFEPDTPVILCFPYGDFKPIEGQYGPQFLYTVEVDGKRDRLYAAPALHDQLQAVGLAQGDILTITKAKNGSRNHWLVQHDGGNG